MITPPMVGGSTSFRKLLCASLIRSREKICLQMPMVMMTKMHSAALITPMMKPVATCQF